MIGLGTVGTPVLLARHGETADNALSMFQGYRDPVLNDRGREQAQELADGLARITAGEDGLALGVCRAGHEGVAGPVGPITEIWASPYARARETAEIIGARLGLPVRLEDRLKESDVGEWAGFTYEQIKGSSPREFQMWVEGDQQHRFPGGESLAEVTERVNEVVAEARQLAPTALLVCHGGVIRAAIQAAGYPAREPAVAQNGEAVAL